MFPNKGIFNGYFPASIVRPYIPEASAEGGLSALGAAKSLLTLPIPKKQALGRAGSACGRKGSHKP